MGDIYYYFGIDKKREVCYTKKKEAKMTDKKMTSFCAGCLYAFIHFSIEVACFYFLFSRISATPSWWILALLFDALAFLTQGIFGCIKKAKIGRAHV